MNVRRQAYLLAAADEDFPLAGLFPHLAGIDLEATERNFPAGSVATDIRVVGTRHSSIEVEGIGSPLS